MKRILINAEIREIVRRERRLESRMDLVRPQRDELRQLVGSCREVLTTDKLCRFQGEELSIAWTREDMRAASKEIKDS